MFKTCRVVYWRSKKTVPGLLGNDTAWGKAFVGSARLIHLSFRPALEAVFTSSVLSSIAQTFTTFPCKHLLLWGHTANPFPWVLNGVSHKSRCWILKLHCILIESWLPNDRNIYVLWFPSACVCVCACAHRACDAGPFKERLVAVALCLGLKVVPFGEMF